MLLHAYSCQSYVGMSSQFEQVIQLSYPGCFYSVCAVSNVFVVALLVIFYSYRFDCQIKIDNYSLLKFIIVLVLRVYNQSIGAKRVLCVVRKSSA